MIQDSMAQKLQSFVGAKIPNIVPLVPKTNMFISSTKEEREQPKNNYQPKAEYKLSTGIIKINYWPFFNKVNLLFIYGLHSQQIFWKSFNSKTRKIKSLGSNGQKHTLSLLLEMKKVILISILKKTKEKYQQWVNILKKSLLVIGTMKDTQ